MKISMNIIIVFFFFVTCLAITASSSSNEETCIRRNINRFRSQAPKSSLETTKKPSPMYDSLVNSLCRDTSRAVMFYVRIHGKFPSNYVKAMCNVFGDDVKKVKEYVVTNWLLLGGSKLVSSLSCDFH
ncbi:unnamed protein product [Cochlearia groenlandica]